MDVSDLITDQTREAEGVWFDYLDGSRVKVASINSATFEAIYSKLTQPYRRQRMQGRLDAVKERELLCKAMSRALLLDWNGFTKGGAALAYSEEAAFDLLMRSAQFRDDVASFAQETERFMAAADEEAEKNSGAPSATA